MPIYLGGGFETLTCISQEHFHYTDKTPCHFSALHLHVWRNSHAAPTSLSLYLSATVSLTFCYTDFTFSSLWEDISFAWACPSHSFLTWESACTATSTALGSPHRPLSIAHTSRVHRALCTLGPSGGLHRAPLHGLQVPMGDSLLLCTSHFRLWDLSPISWVYNLDTQLQFWGHTHLSWFIQQYTGGTHLLHTSHSYTHESDISLGGWVSFYTQWDLSLLLHGHISPTTIPSQVTHGHFSRACLSGCPSLPSHLSGHTPCTLLSHCLLSLSASRSAHTSHAVSLTLGPGLLSLVQTLSLPSLTFRRALWQ